MTSRTQRSTQERDARSRAAQFLAKEPFLRGTLVLQHRSCGKSYCRCQRGEKHSALYRYTSSAGQPVRTYIPRALHETVRQWVDNGRRIKRLVDDVSQHNLQTLLQQKQPLLTRQGPILSADPAR
jgi:hypothetical protein